MIDSKDLRLNYFRIGGEACGKTVTESDRGVGEDLHTCHEGTTAVRKILISLLTEVIDGDRVLGHGSGR